MPRIPVYSNTQEVNPQPLGEAAYRIDRMGQIVGASLRGGFNSLAEAAKNMEQHQAIQETSSVSAAGAKAFLDLSQSMDQALSNADPNKIDQAADDWRTKVLQPALDQIGADADTPEGQAAAERVRNSLLTEFSRQSYAAQSTVAGSNVAANLISTRDSLAQAVANNPSLLPHAQVYMAGTLEDQLHAHNLSAEDASQVRTKFGTAAIEQITEAGAASYLDRAIKDPNASAQSLDNAWQFINDPKNGFMGHLSPDASSSLQQKYINAKETIGSMQDEIAKVQWPKVLTAVRQGDPDALKWAQQFASTYQAPTAKDTPVERAKLQSDLQDAQDFYKATSTYRNMPQPEISAQYDTLKSRAQAGDKMAKAAVQAIDTRWTDYHRDPAMYVLANNDVVQSRYQDYAKSPSPQTFAAYAQASSAEQSRLYPGETPHLVTKDMMHAVATEIAAIPRTPEGAAAAASTLSQYANLTGKYWPQVVSELEQAHVLSPVQAVAGQLWMKPEARGVAEELLRATTVSPKELGTRVTSSAASKAAASALADFRAAILPQANGKQIYASYANALSLVLQSRGDLSQASSLARQMIMDEYQFSGSLMVPTAAKVDLHAVVAGTRNIQADISNHARHDLVIPPSYSGTGPADQKAEYIRDVQKSGYWIMSSDNTGAMLVTERGDPVYERRGGKIQQIVVPWATLQKLGE